MKKRGLRRYYRNLALHNPVLNLLHNRIYQKFGYDYEHIHLNDYDLTCWKEIKQHLDALFRQMEIVQDHKNELPINFQLWGYVCFQKKFGCQVILYIHSPNSDANDYPADFSNFIRVPTVANPVILNYFQSKEEDGFSIYWSKNFDKEPEILITHPDIGDPIIINTGREVINETHVDGGDVFMELELYS